MILAERRLNVAFAPAKNSTTWRQLDPMTWPELVDWLHLEHPADRRECGCYVGGLLRDGKRDGDHVVSRSVLALDADKASPTLLGDVRRTLPGVAAVVHTTWRHTVNGFRYRLLAPLSRDVSGAEYERLAIRVRDALGAHWGSDKGCPEPERFMYLPSAQNESYEHHVIDGQLLDVDDWLTDDEPELDPYTAKAIAAELDRLDECEVLGWGGPPWNNTTHAVACNLIEFANSDWSDYTLEAAHAHLMERAPRDEGFGPVEHEKCWASALQTVGDRARPNPDGDPSEDFTATSGKRKAPLPVQLREYVQEHYDVFPAGRDGRIWVLGKQGGGRAELLTPAFIIRATRGIGGRFASLSQAAAEAGKVLAALAADHEPRPLALRAHYRRDRIVLDLGQRNTRCVVVTPDGWTVEDVPPPGVVFESSAEALPDPVRGGSVDELRELLGWKPDEARWLLVRGWLPASLMATAPRPMLGLFGQQGSGKTSTGRLVLSLLDPKPSGVLGGAFGKSRDDDESKALGSYLVAWDNVTTMSADTADFLSRLVTGDRVERRQFYTEFGLVGIDYRRTGVVTGVVIPRGLKPDTLDRFVMLALPPMREDERMSEAELDAAWQRVQPRALAGVLDDAARMLAGLPAAKNPAGLRMADYAQGLWAIDPALYDAYAANVGVARADMAAEDPFVGALLEWLRNCEGQEWEGIAEEARQAAQLYDTSDYTWPRSAKSFSDQVTRTVELLRAVGITVESRSSNGRKLKHFRLA
jgi:hypothetical protein